MASRGRRRDPSDRYYLVSAVRLFRHLPLDSHIRPQKKFCPALMSFTRLVLLVPSPPSVSSAVWASSVLPHSVRGKLGILLKGAKMMLCLFILGAHKAKKQQNCTYICIYSIYKAVYFCHFVFFFWFTFIVTMSFFVCFFMSCFLCKKKKKKDQWTFMGLFSCLFVCFCSFFFCFFFGASRNRGAATSAWCQSSHLAREHTLPHVGKRTLIQNELKK